MGWDKDDKNVVLFGFPTGEHASFLFTINVESKKGNSVKIAEGRLDERLMMFLPQLDKLIYAPEYGGIASISMFDPASGENKVIYEHRDHFIQWH